MSTVAPSRLRVPFQRLPLRAFAALAVIALAYHYSLLSLARGLTLQTPLAYLALVPLISLLLGWVIIARAPNPRPIHDRQLDYIIGVILLLVAASVAVLVPATMSHQYWLYRIDLLSLPLFAAGILAIFYGLRHLWALRLPIAFLFLTWPVPYLPIAGDGMRLSTDLTVRALTWVSDFVPFALPTGDEGLFWVTHAGEQFPLSVASACSGVNSLVGFMLVGGALTLVLKGSWWRRAAWLLCGIVVIWVLNL